MEIKTITNGAITIRKANLNDIDTLIRILRDSFPYVVSYQGPKYFNKKKWSFIIECPFVEVYVINLNNQVAGTATIVSNEIKYSKWKKQNNSPLPIRILTIIAYPKLIFSLFRKTINRLLYKSTENNIFPNYDNSVYSNRLWIEPIAISAKHRRNNLAKKLLSFIECRAMELKKDAICLSVEAKNIHAISLYESQNFKLYKKDKMDLLYYRKLLINEP